MRETESPEQATRSLLCLVSDAPSVEMAVDRALRKSEERVRELLECAPDAMLVVDEDGRIVLVNAQVTALFGYEPHELMDEPVELLVPERFRAAHRRERDGFLRPPGRCPMRPGLELWALRRDGSEFPVEISLRSLRTSAGAMVSAAIRDITERKRLEETAAEASRLKSEFVANMSHEIRTPLNGIVGLTQLLLNTELSRGQREYAEMIGSSAEALLTVVNDVLDFSRIEAGKLELERSDFDPHETLDSVLAMVAAAAGEKQLELIVSVDTAVPTMLRSDGNRVRRVLANILANAVKFTPSGTVLTRVTAEQHDAGCMLRFEVSDTGIGIAPAILEHVFDAFVQADASTTCQYGGTGLGLTICQDLVGLLGGEIGASSAPGQGSTFWFTVPCDRARYRGCELDRGRLQMITLTGDPAHAQGRCTS
jgi:PAS domain S-box-containing protein